MHYGKLTSLYSRFCSEDFDYPTESGVEGEYKCDECPKSFQWKANLLRHQVCLSVKLEKNKIPTTTRAFM